MPGGRAAQSAGLHSHRSCFDHPLLRPPICPQVQLRRRTGYAVLAGFVALGLLRHTVHRLPGTSQADNRSERKGNAAAEPPMPKTAAAQQPSPSPAPGGDGNKCNSQLTKATDGSGKTSKHNKRLSYDLWVRSTGRGHAVLFKKVGRLVCLWVPCEVLSPRGIAFQGGGQRDLRTLLTLPMRPKLVLRLLLLLVLPLWLGAWPPCGCMHGFAGVVRLELFTTEAETMVAAQKAIQWSMPQAAKDLIVTKTKMARSASTIEMEQTNVYSVLLLVNECCLCRSQHSLQLIAGCHCRPLVLQRLFVQPWFCWESGTAMSATWLLLPLERHRGCRWCRWLLRCRERFKRWHHRVRASLPSIGKKESAPPPLNALDTDRAMGGSPSRRYLTRQQHSKVRGRFEYKARGSIDTVLRRSGGAGACDTLSQFFVL